MKPIKYKKKYEILIAKAIIQWFYKYFFKDIERVISTNYVINNDDILINAIKSGSIYYRNGAFYSSKGVFSSAISAELKKIGAKYSNYRKAYIIKAELIPIHIYSVMEMVKANTLERVALLQSLLNLQLGVIDELQKKIVIDTIVKTIMQDLQNRVYKNFKDAKIETITPKINDYRIDEIAKRYTTNLDYWIKNWTENEIIKMREVVEQMAIDGSSITEIAKYIQKEYKVAKNKALFLARNETAIATTSYLVAKYQDEGFTEFRWITNYDGRERKLHAELGLKTNNKYGRDKTNIFRFDNPPIIDERTGQRGMPAETYNCRCAMIPVINKEFMERRIKK